MFAVILALLVSIPTGTMLFAWYKAIKGDAPRALLLLVSASYLLFLLGLWLPVVWGPFYSDRRFATIWINLAFNAAVLLFLLVRKPGQQKWVALSAGAVVLAWLYAWAVNSVV